jgi:hypothetical protein
LLLDCFKKRCLAMVRETFVGLVLESRRIFIVFVTE